MEEPFENDLIMKEISENGFNFSISNAKSSSTDLIDEYFENEKSDLPFTLTNWNTLACSPNSFKCPLSNGLETIPEYEISESLSFLQPLVPPELPISEPFSYNISFPTTLQPRDHRYWPIRMDSMNNLQKILPTSPIQNHSFCLDGNKVDNYSELNKSGMTTDDDNRSIKSNKSNKRSRRNTPNGSISGCPGDVGDSLNDMDLEVDEKRNRKKVTSIDNKRRDSIKWGLGELQKVLPHLGPPTEEKISQAGVLYEASKYIQNYNASQSKTIDSIENVRNEIDRLNEEIELLQSQLPDHGATLIPKVMMTRNLADKFHDHVVHRTLQDWRYWVFTSIMGHFVHSFDREIKPSSLNDLEESSMKWITNNMSLQQLRKDAYRKLAKLCAKTSIVDDPTKLSEEAMSFVVKRERLQAAALYSCPSTPNIRTSDI